MGDGRQQYIPVSRAKVKDAIFQLDVIDEEMHDGLAKVSEMLEAIWHHSSHGGLENLKRLYEDMDPDQIGEANADGSEEFLSTLEDFLIDGNWEEITDEEMEEALDGEDGLLGVGDGLIHMAVTVEVACGEDRAITGLARGCSGELQQTDGGEEEGGGELLEVLHG